MASSQIWLASPMVRNGERGGALREKTCWKQQPCHVFGCGFAALGLALVGLAKSQRSEWELTSRGPQSRDLEQQHCRK